MKTKQIPAIVMLLGGAVACIVSYMNNYTLREMLIVLTVSLVVFLCLGVVIRLVLDSFEMPDDSKVDDEGEVVEKQGEASEDEEEEGIDEDTTDDSVMQ